MGCHTGCSKRPDISPAQPRRAKTPRSTGKAAASEEARRYVPHFVWAVRRYMGLGQQKNPSRVPASKTVLLRIEVLSDARTPLADFVSILLERYGDGDDDAWTTGAVVDGDQLRHRDRLPWGGRATVLEGQPICFVGRSQPGTGWGSDGFYPGRSIHHG